jgi:major membrane immunogen (membrane-anchored lipoprotein)
VFTSILEPKMTKRILTVVLCATILLGGCTASSTMPLQSENPAFESGSATVFSDSTGRGDNMFGSGN